MINIYLQILFAGIFGSIMGSFANMLAHRLPNGEDVIFKPSYCPCCNARLRLPDLIPIFSWLALIGKCRSCKKPIKPRYFLMELASMVTYIAIILSFPLSQAVIIALATTCILIIIVVDLEHMIIPDSMQVSLLILGIIYSFLIYEPMNIVYGGITGLATGLALYYGSIWIKKVEALGFGDVKFLGVSGVWLGVINFVPFLFFAGIFGIITAIILKQNRFPFAPALATSLLMIIIFPESSGYFWEMFMVFK